MNDLTLENARTVRDLEPEEGGDDPDRLRPALVAAIAAADEAMFEIERLRAVLLDIMAAANGELCCCPQGMPAGLHSQVCLNAQAILQPNGQDKARP